jgi:hypothetical protein
MPALGTMLRIRTTGRHIPPAGQRVVNDTPSAGAFGRARGRLVGFSRLRQDLGADNHLERSTWHINADEVDRLRCKRF